MKCYMHFTSIVKRKTKWRKTINCLCRWSNQRTRCHFQPQHTQRGCQLLLAIFFKHFCFHLSAHVCLLISNRHMYILYWGRRILISSMVEHISIMALKENINVLYLMSCWRFLSHWGWNHQKDRHKNDCFASRNIA